MPTGRALGIAALAVVAVIVAVIVAGGGGPVRPPGGSAADPDPSPTGQATEAGPSPTPRGPCGSLQARIDAAPSGSTLDLIGCTYTTGATVDKSLTILGATIRPPGGTDGLLVTADDVTLAGLTIDGPQDRVFDPDEHGIHLRGTASDPIDGVTIRDSEISEFGYGGIYADHATDLLVTGNDVHDCVYAGIMVLSGRDGRVAASTVARIGVYGADANAGNAYGIALSNEEGQARTQRFVVDGNTVTDVPTWHALDTHGGLNIAFTDNVVSRSSRGLFLTSGATDITVTGNRFDPPYPAIFNLLAVTTAGTTNVTITGNTAQGWGDRVFDDYGGDSSGLVVRDNLPVGAWPTIP